MRPTAPTRPGRRSAPHTSLATSSPAPSHELGRMSRSWPRAKTCGLLPVRRTRLGAYAELVAVNAAFVRPRPQALGPLEAASLPVAGSTSLQLLDRLGL